MAIIRKSEQAEQAAGAGTAATIPGYARLARQELDAFVRLLGELSPEDWDRPTPCALWTVRDVVAHQAGHVQMGAGLRGFVAQLNPRATSPYRKRGMSMLDALNQHQVDIRKGLPVEDVVAEVRDGTPRSIAARARLNPVVRNVPVPAPGFGMVRLGTLLYRVFPRDMWIHRLDIADATGRDFALQPGHDSVMVAQAVDDVDRYVQKKGRGLSFVLTLAGPAGGTWALGGGSEPVANIRMDVPGFMRRSSGRASVEAALPLVESSGAEPVTRRCLELLQCLY